jgi:hypothetical protein
LLFDDSAFAFVFRDLASAAGCDLACLHQLANVSKVLLVVLERAMSTGRLTIARICCRLRASRARS